MRISLAVGGDVLGQHPGIGADHIDIQAWLDHEVVQDVIEGGVSQFMILLGDLIQVRVFSLHLKAVFRPQRGSCRPRR